MLNHLDSLKAEEKDAMYVHYMQLTKGNTYTTTLHCINSCIVKLGKLTVASKVYRGVSGGKLPPQFWTPNDYNVRGGVEFAFTSTTTNGEVARRYASTAKVGMLIEVQMGMVDRGADLEWLSQYPAEKGPSLAPQPAPLMNAHYERTHVFGSRVGRNLLRTADRRRGAAHARGGLHARRRGALLGQPDRTYDRGGHRQDAALTAAAPWHHDR